MINTYFNSKEELMSADEITTFFLSSYFPRLNFSILCHSISRQKPSNLRMLNLHR